MQLVIAGSGYTVVLDKHGPWAINNNNNNYYY